MGSMLRSILRETWQAKLTQMMAENSESANDIVGVSTWKFDPAKDKQNPYIMWTDRHVYFVTIQNEDAQIFSVPRHPGRMPGNIKLEDVKWDRCLYQI